MESKGDLTGTLAQLPDGQLVIIEEIHADGYATVRRIDGDRAGTLAVCKVSKLAMNTDLPTTFCEAT